MRSETYRAIAEEYFLTTLAFAESPEHFQVSGPFPRDEYHYTKRAHAYAADKVCVAIAHLAVEGIELAPDMLGQALAYIPNHHGVDGLDGLDAATSEKVAYILGKLPQSYPEFRRRRGKKEMSI